MCSSSHISKYFGWLFIARLCRIIERVNERNSFHLSFKTSLLYQEREREKEKHRDT